MQGIEKGSGGLFSVQDLASTLIPENSVWTYLAEHRQVLFPESLFADLFHSSLGRPSLPGSVIATGLLLQNLEGLSDRTTAERMSFDLRWKMACGLAVDEVAPDHSVLASWRRRIAQSTDPDRVLRALAQVVAACGLVRPKTFDLPDSEVAPVDQAGTDSSPATTTQEAAPVYQVEPDPTDTPDSETMAPADQVETDPTAATTQEAEPVDQVEPDPTDTSSSETMAPADQVGTDPTAASAADLAADPVASPPPSGPIMQGKYLASGFTFDAAAGVVRCPGGFTTKPTASGRVNFTQFCRRCVVRPWCPKGGKGQAIRLDPTAFPPPEHSEEA